MARNSKSVEVSGLQAQLAAIEAEYGLTVVSIFPGTDPNSTEADVLRTLIPSVRQVGEEIKKGKLQVVPLDD